MSFRSVQSCLFMQAIKTEVGAPIYPWDEERQRKREIERGSEGSGKTMRRQFGKQNAPREDPTTISKRTQGAEVLSKFRTTRAILPSPWYIREIEWGKSCKSYSILWVRSILCFPLFFLIPAFSCSRNCNVNGLDFTRESLREAKTSRDIERLTYIAEVKW